MVGPLGSDGGPTIREFNGKRRVFRRKIGVVHGSKPVLADAGTGPGMTECGNNSRVL